MQQQIIDIIQNAYKTIDGAWMLDHTKKLLEIERKQNFSAYHEATEYVYNVLRGEGFETELLTFPADGKTAYMDRRMPLAWDATMGRLTVLSAPKKPANPVIADYAANPFSFVKHSVATPEGGISAYLITEAQAFSGVDCRGAMVLLDTGTQPTSAILAPLLDLGALGFVSDYLTTPALTPDGVFWANAATDSGDWHATLEDRDFIGFMVSPKVGKQLREQVNRGDVEVLVESDGRRYEGTLPAVTALLPGKRKEELWVLAHMFEPLCIDNSTGVMGSVAALLCIQKMIQSGALPPLNFSIRVVFAMEVYGFAAVVDSFGGYLGDKTIGAINIDAPPAGKANSACTYFWSPFSAPFYGKDVYRMVADAFATQFDKPKMQVGYPSFHDELCYADSSIGLSMIWPEGMESLTDMNEAGWQPLWHNSFLDESFLEEETFTRSMALYVAWIAIVTTMDQDTILPYAQKAAELAQKRLNAVMGSMERRAFFLEQEKKQLLHFLRVADCAAVQELAEGLSVPETAEREVVENPWLLYAEGIVPERKQVGFPFSQAWCSAKDKRNIPDMVIYGPMAFILSAMDGKKTLRQLMQEAFWERNMDCNKANCKAYVLAVSYLAEVGYLTATFASPITKQVLLAALKELGVSEGDVLMVHSALSGLGHIVGGADTIIDSLLEAVGEAGTVMMPCFTRPYIGFEGVVNKARNYRPFSYSDKENISTGTIPKKLLKREGTLRSAHATHSWCGRGPLAEACLSAHGLLDPPASENSPMAFARKNGGKIIMFGCGVGSNTFLHHLETMAEAVYLQNAIVKIQDADGTLHTEVIHKHLPGHRDFYGLSGLNAKIYTKAIERGLDIRSVSVGAGKLVLMDMAELYEIGSALLAEDPNLLLCDHPNCSFCAPFKR